MKPRILISLCLMSLGTASAFAWGQKGHDTTAAIAERHLTPATLSAVTDLLDGKSIVYWSNWLDNASHTDDFAYTKTWHYKNIDRDVKFADAPVNPKGDVVTAINQQKAVLADPKATKADRQLALKIIVHLLGDIHQPMHLGHATDLGGNKCTVIYFGRENNLHSIWDSAVPESAHKWTYTEWTDQLDRLNQKQTAQITSVTDPAQWAEETFEIAKRVYLLTPDNTKISYDYIADWTPVVEEQFLKGGLRLAALLNGIFDPQE